MARSELSVLHFSLSDLEGGAARAALRTHVALRNAGARSHVLVRSKVSDDPGVEVVDPLPVWESRRRRIRRLLPPGNRLPEPIATFNFDVEQDYDERSLHRFAGDVDVLCLHRITRFLTVRQIRGLYEHYRCPLVWVVLDQQPVTGGCHYSFGCTRYTESCGACPILESDDPNDVSHVIWERKRTLLDGIPLTFVTPSGDTEDWVRNSSLFGLHRVERIPLPIDADVFRPVEQAAAREVLGIPLEAKVVLLAAAALHAPRKGTALGLEALRKLEQLADTDLRRRLFVLAAGEKSEEAIAASSFPGRAIGPLSDELALALVYQAADAFLSPSVADAGPMMVPEALLTGTPVVAFELGYASDLITDPAVGAVAAPKDVEGLARGLHETVLRRRDPDACRSAALGFASDRVAAAHLELYTSLTNEAAAPGGRR